MLIPFKVLLTILKPFLFREILVPGRRVTCAPQLTTFPTSPYKTWQTVNMTNKSWLFFIKTLWLTQPGQLGQGETIRACASAVLDNKSMRASIVGS